MAKLVRIVIQLPMDLKTRLDGLKQQGYTTSGFIRAMLERELAKIDQQMPDQKPLTLVPDSQKSQQPLTPFLVRRSRSGTSAPSSCTGHINPATSVDHGSDRSMA